MINVLKRNNVKVYGDGPRSIVFAHGFGCDQHVWRHLIEAFKTDYKCVVFDYVGAGESDLTAYDSLRYSTLDGYAQDVLDVCESLSLNNPIFVGHSVSSMVGVRASLLKPGYFSKLVLVTPSPSYINEAGYIGGMEKNDLDDLLEMMESNYLGWSGYIAPLVMGNAGRPELGEELTANFCSTDPSIAIEFAKVTFLTDSRADLRKLQTPSLSLQCADDILAPMAVGEFIKAHTANNSLVILDATGHCPHLSAPLETIRAIRSYLETSDLSMVA